MKSIKDLTRKINIFLSREAKPVSLRTSRGGDIFVGLIIILTATLSFGLGILSERAGEENQIKLINEEAAVLLSSEKLESGEVEVIPNRNKGGQVVASKNGNKYHFPWCSGAQRMKEENKVWFENIQAARTAGYTPAGNCKGLE